MRTHPLLTAIPFFLAPLPHTSHRSLGGVFLALGYGFRAENRASRTLFTTAAKRCHRLFTFSLLAISMTYAPGPLLTSHPSRILVRGPENEISERWPSYFRHVLPPAIHGY